MQGLDKVMESLRHVGPEGSGASGGRLDAHRPGLEVRGVVGQLGRRRPGRTRANVESQGAVRKNTAGEGLLGLAVRGSSGTPASSVSVGRWQGAVEEGAGLCPAHPR